MLSVKQPEPLPVQVIIPRPKTITCGPGGIPSHVIWTYDRGVDTPKVKVETCTQTDTGITTPEAIFASLPNSSMRSRLDGRKRSAETQTGKIEYKVSQEAQTLNVTKRRRTSKKQIAEAETQCSVSRHPLTTTTSRSDSDEISTPENKSDSATTIMFSPGVAPVLNAVGTGGISLQALMSMVGIDGDQEQVSSSQFGERMTFGVEKDDSKKTPSSTPTSNVVNVLDQQFESGVDGYKTKTSGGVSTSEVCVGFDEPFDLMNLDDFLRFELTRETQTDAFLSEFNDQPTEPSFNSFVTTETQTSFIISESETNDDSYPMDTFSLNLLTPTPSEWNSLNVNPTGEVYTNMNCDEDNAVDTMLLSHDGNRNSSPSYLETIDGETQTTFSDDISDDQLMMDCLLPSIFNQPATLNPEEPK